MEKIFLIFIIRSSNEAFKETHGKKEENFTLMRVIYV